MLHQHHKAGGVLAFKNHKAGGVFDLENHKNLVSAAALNET